MELYELMEQRLKYGWLVHFDSYPHVRFGGDGINPIMKIPLNQPYSKYDFYYSFNDGLDCWLKSARIMYDSNPKSKFLLYPEDFLEGRMVAVIWYYLPKEGYVRTVINARNGLVLHQQSHNSRYGLGTVALLICTEYTLLEGYQYKSFACSPKDIPKINNFMIDFGHDGDLTIEPIKLQSLPRVEHIPNNTVD
jgi:hypothetical protein